MEGERHQSKIKMSYKIDDDGVCPSIFAEKKHVWTFLSSLFLSPSFSLCVYPDSGCIRGEEGES